MTLSSLKAEWVALFEAIKEIMCMIQLLKSMKISVKLPVMIRVNYVGAIFMASDITTTRHTKNMDVWYKYVNENVDDGIVKITFIKSAKNDSNNCTRSMQGK